MTGSDTLVEPDQSAYTIPYVLVANKVYDIIGVTPTQWMSIPIN